MHHSATSLFRGAVVGCGVATLVLIFAGTWAPARAVMYPFAVLGFVLGNIHQGNAVISIAALYVAFSLGGALLSFAFFRLFRARGGSSTGA